MRSAVMDMPVVGIACVLLACFSLLGQCCNPAEIGQKYTITSANKSGSSSTVIWKIGKLNNIYDNKNQSHPNVYPELYNGNSTQLTILNVSINDGSRDYQRIINGTIVYVCTLSVYKRASTPTCEPVTLTGNNLKTTCTTTEVFPQAKCQFTLENGEMDRKNITDETSDIEYTHTGPQSEGNEYNSTSCTLLYPVNELKPGNWTVQVTMYPDQTNVSLAQGTTGQPEIYLLNNSLTDQPEKKDSPPLAAVVGGAVGAVVVIAVVVVGVIFYIRKGSKQKEATSSDRNRYDPTTANIDNSDPYNAYVFMDNSELYASAAARGYNPHRDAKPEFKDNSELYATVSKVTTEAPGGPPQYSASTYDDVDLSEQVNHQKG